MKIIAELFKYLLTASGIHAKVATMKTGIKPLWIPTPLHMEIKSAAAKRGVSLQDLSVSILTAGLTREQNPTKRKK